MEDYSEFDSIPPKQESYLIADECGFAIVKDGPRILFRNRCLMPYHHFSWFLGVLAGIFLLYMLLNVYMIGSGEGGDAAGTQLIISIVLFSVTIMPFLFCIITYRRRKKLKPEDAPLKYVADLTRGVLTTGKGRVLCSLSEMEIQIKTAWDTYLASGDDYYENVLFRWGFFRSACVFKTTTGYMAKDVVERLKEELLHQSESNQE